MRHQTTLNARRHAPGLRRDMTDAERCVWPRLRHEQLGVKFRRQHPIGAYVLDFACLAPKLAIEIDGSQHLDQSRRDERRDAWLCEQGFFVLRFWANDALSQIDGVVERVIVVLERLRAPTPALPREGRESLHRALPGPGGDGRQG